MSKKYNRTYKKGKFLTGSVKSIKADKSRSRNVLPKSKIALWRSDTRKYDLEGIDTRPEDTSGTFLYKFRSKKKMGKNPNRQNKTYRRYWR